MGFLFTGVLPLILTHHTYVGESVRFFCLTQQLVEGVEDGAPGLSCLPTNGLCKVSGAAVDVETVDALQHQADHALYTHTHTLELLSVCL